MSKIFPATDLTGGIFGALDAIGGTLLGDGDAAIVITQGREIYHYTLDATSGAAEDVPNVITPDTDPGAKRWLLASQPLSNIDYIGFNPNPTGVPATEGTFFVDRATRMPAYKPDVSSSTWNAGLESWTRVRNETGVEIPDGAAVFGAGVVVSPDTGELTFLVVPALAIPGQIGIPGIATSLIPKDGEGFATTRGGVKSYNTSGFTPLDEIFLSDTVGGALVIDPPSPPNYPIPVGYAMDSAADGKIYVYAQNPTSIVAAVDAAVASGDPTGFHDSNNILEEYDPVTRTITLTGSLKYSWRGQVKELTSPWTSDPHPVGLDVGYFLYSNDGENFIWSTTPWLFSDVQSAFVWHGTTDKYALREIHGLMPWQTHQEFHQTVGTYRISGGDVGDFALTSTTPADRRPSVAEMSVKDEDITTINALLDSPIYTQGLLTGAGIIDFLAGQTDIVPLNGDIPYYNQFVSPNWIQTPMANNSYMSVWLVGVPVTSDSGSQDFRYLWMQGQTAGTLANQEALFPEDLALGNFAELFTEFVFSAKIILRYQTGNWHIAEVQNLTGTRARTTGSPSGGYLTEVTTDATLTGAGTVTSPLSVVDSGGGLYELVESRTMTGNALELFTTGADDNIMFLFDTIGLSADDFFAAALSIDGGLTYPATHNETGHRIAEGSASFLGTNFSTQTKIFLNTAQLKTDMNGEMFLNQVANTLRETHHHFDMRGLDNAGAWGRFKIGGPFKTVGIVDKIKFFATGGATIDTGTIHHLKRTI